MNRISSTSKRVTIIMFVFVIGVVIGTSVFDHALAKNLSGSGEVSFPQNKNGLTYGSSADASSPDKEPDLIKAYGVGGTIGYV